MVLPVSAVSSRQTTVRPGRSDGGGKRCMKTGQEKKICPPSRGGLGYVFGRRVGSYCVASWTGTGSGSAVVWSPAILILLLRRWKTFAVTLVLSTEAIIMSMVPDATL